MNWELVYTISNAIVLPAWIMLLFAPKSSLAKNTLYNYAYPIVLAIGYAFFILIGTYQNWGVDNSGMHSLASLRNAFNNDMVLIAAWMHYLCFDMLIGIWIAKRASASNSNSILTKICLFLTLMFGPIGFLVYQAYTSWYQKN